MQPVELQEFFGQKVFVQLRDAVARVRPTGKEERSVLIKPSGDPLFVNLGKEVGPASRPQYLAEYDDEKKFELTLECRILPAEAGRVFLLYEVNGYVVKLSMRPSDIYAVSIVEQKMIPEPSAIITPG
jgi:hypothetical protein